LSSFAIRVKVSHPLQFVLRIYCLLLFLLSYDECLVVVALPYTLPNLARFPEPSPARTIADTPVASTKAVRLQEVHEATMQQFLRAQQHADTLAAANMAALQQKMADDRAIHRFGAQGHLHQPRVPYPTSYLAASKEPETEKLP
jgi:hypothetical protein